MSALQFCQFCGQHVIAACADETDLTIYRRTVDRCSDAAFNYEGERHFERRTSSLPTPERDAAAK